MLYMTRSKPVSRRAGDVHLKVNMLFAIQFFCALFGDSVAQSAPTDEENSGSQA